MITYKVIITDKADKDETNIYMYIYEQFGQIYANRFRDKLIQFFLLLSKQPFIGRPAKNDLNIRVFLFSKQNKVIYTLTETDIIVLRILHTKTNLASRF